MTEEQTPVEDENAVQTPVEDESEDKESTTNKFTIMAVEDSSVLRRVLVAHLVKGGYEVIEVENGQEALKALQRNKPDVMIVDLMMPVMDGFTLAERVRADEELKDIPIIFCTAKREHDDIVRAIELGAADYIAKPFNGANVLSKILKILVKTYPERFDMEKSIDCIDEKLNDFSEKKTENEEEEEEVSETDETETVEAEETTESTEEVTEDEA